MNWEKTMKKLILLLTCLFITTTYATERFELSTQVATCYVLTPAAVESGSIILDSMAAKKCLSLGAKYQPSYDTYLEVHSMGVRNYCGGVEVSRFFTCYKIK